MDEPTRPQRRKKNAPQQPGNASDMAPPRYEAVQPSGRKEKKSKKPAALAREDEQHNVRMSVVNSHLVDQALLVSCFVALNRCKLLAHYERWMHCIHRR